MVVTRPNLIWAMDITYVPLARGSACLAAFIVWFSRKILAWRQSIDFGAASCTAGRERRRGMPRARKE